VLFSQSLWLFILNKSISSHNENSATEMKAKITFQNNSSLPYSSKTTAPG